MCLVRPAFPVSLDYSLLFVCLPHVSCSPSIASLSGLFIVVCLSSPCVLFAQHCQSLWIIHCCLFVFPMSCSPSIASLSGLFIVVCLSSPCLVRPALPVSLDYSLLFVCLPHVSCSPSISSLSGLFIVVCSLLFSLSFI